MYAQAEAHKPCGLQGGRLAPGRPGGGFHRTCTAREHDWAPRRLRLAHRDWQKGGAPNSLPSRAITSLQDTAWHAYGFAPMRLCLPFLSPSPLFHAARHVPWRHPKASALSCSVTHLANPVQCTPTCRCTQKGIRTYMSAEGECCGVLASRANWPAFYLPCAHRAQPNAVAAGRGALGACWELNQI